MIERKDILPVKIENIARLTQVIKYFNVWKLELVKDKKTGKERIVKMPYNPKTKRKGRVNDVETFGTFEEAVNAYKSGKYDGLGVTGNESFVLVDIDNCISSTGELSDFAKMIIKRLNTYTELSPTGTGIHCLCLSSQHFNYDKDKYYMNNKSINLEIYPAWATNRIATVTGNILDDIGMLDIADCVDELQLIRDEYMLKKKKGDQDFNWALNNTPALATLWNRTESDNGTQSDKSESEHDMTILNAIVLHHSKDKAEIIKFFESSPYYQSKDSYHKNKWEREDYRENTISKILDGCFPHVNDKQKPLKHWENTEHLCTREGIVIKYNSLAKIVEVNPLQHLTADAVITELQGRGLLRGLSLTASTVSAHIDRIAEKNKYNPAADYFNICKSQWDRIHRIRQTFNELFIISPDYKNDADFLSELFRKWLVSVVKMSFNDGNIAAQGVLILHGPGNIGKTELIYQLLPNPAWYKTGAFINQKDKDTKIQLLGYLIVELSEYAALNSSNRDYYKAFITDSTDEFRRPYARCSAKHPRTTVFYATTDKAEFLNDSAGERRNWIIPVESINRPTIDKDQLWGEVAYLALDVNYPISLNQEELNKLNKSVIAFKLWSTYAQVILDECDFNTIKSNWFTVTSTMLCEIFNEYQVNAAQMGKALNELNLYGIEKCKCHEGRFYKIPPFKKEELNQKARDIIHRNSDRKYPQSRKFRILKNDDE